METDSSSAAAATNISYELAYGRASTLEEALAQMNVSKTPVTMGNASTNNDVDEQRVIEEALELSESVVAEVPIVKREGPKRLRRNVFIYAARREVEMPEAMAAN